MKKISFIIMLFFAIASGAIAQNGIDSNKIFTKDELTELPQFHGGEDALNKYLLNNLKYPVVAEENGIQRLVNVSFIVRRDMRRSMDFTFLLPRWHLRAGRISNR